MADIRGEPSVALDPALERGRHVVERVGEHAEVGVLGGLESGVEPTAGDRLGRLGGNADRSNGAAGGERPGQHAERGGDHRAEHQ